MSIDLGQALRAAVDHPGPGPLGDARALTSLRSRVRRRRTVQAGARAAVGAGAACAVGAGALWAGSGRSVDTEPPSTATSPAPRVWAAAPVVEPVVASTSPFCGAAVGDLAADPAGLTVSLGSTAEGELAPLRLAGRTLGPAVPVWVTVPAGSWGGSELAVANAEVVVVQDGVVVGVVEDAATTLPADEATDAITWLDDSAVPDAEPTPDSAGVIAACPGVATAGPSGQALPSGDYALHAVVALGAGATHRAVSAAVPLTLLPEQPLLTEDDALPADFPRASVPVVGDRVVSARSTGGGGWEVTVAVSGTDALLRAGQALGIPGLGTNALWAQLGSSGSQIGDGAEATSDRTAHVALVAIARAAVLDPEGPLGITEAEHSGEGFTVAGTQLRIAVRSATTADDGPVLVYRVTPRP
jgi:hypothetical protein